jgi:hypothetical protein
VVAVMASRARIRLAEITLPTLGARLRLAVLFILPALRAIVSLLRDRRPLLAAFAGAMWRRAELGWVTA